MEKTWDGDLAEIMGEVKRKGKLGASEFRRLNDLGFPMFRICTENITYEYLERAIKEWYGRAKNGMC